VPTQTPNPSRTDFGESYRRNRDMNDLSQQNYHVLCEAAGIKLYNSQFSHLEQGKLVLKPETFLELAKLNKIIASKKFPPAVSITGKFTKEIRDKFKQAEPYLDAENNPVVDGWKFYGLFVGEFPINEIYKIEGVKITEDVCTNISEFCRTVFRGKAVDEMIDRKEAWESIKEFLEPVTDKKFLKRMREVFAGQSNYTVPEIEKSTKHGTATRCPYNEAICEWAGIETVDLVTIWTQGAKLSWEKLTS